MFKKGDIVIVKFPYTNLKKFKFRPALIISDNRVNETGDYILMQITSKFKNDELTFELDNGFYSENKSLPLKSYLKLHKVFTINEELIQKKHTELAKFAISTILFKFNTLFR
jgi:mRNA interferase MazF